MIKAFPSVAAILLFAGVCHPQDAVKGKQLFEKFGCYTCHGHLGQGGIAGPKLAPSPIATQAFIKYTHHPTGSMPPYTQKVITDEDLTDIHAFLASIPAPKPLKDLPLLNQ